MKTVSFWEVIDKHRIQDESIHRLANIFRRRFDQPAEILLVGGYSGVGKSALIGEIHPSTGCRLGERRNAFAGRGVPAADTGVADTEDVSTVRFPHNLAGLILATNAEPGADLATGRCLEDGVTAHDVGDRDLSAVRLPGGPARGLEVNGQFERCDFTRLDVPDVSCKRCCGGEVGTYRQTLAVG